MVTTLPIYTKKLTDLIMVKPPYNVLYNIKENSESGGLTAQVDNEYQYEHEGGAIGITEAGRHIAILGSMCLARDYGFEEPHYFLATHADMERKSSSVSSSDYLNLAVKTTSLSKREGQIYGEIYDEQQTCVFVATITYKVLRTSSFDRLFRADRLGDEFVQNQMLQASPYRHRRTLSQVTIQGDTATGLHNMVLPQECVGHFSNYRALPVAIIGNHFVELGMKLFHDATDYQFDRLMALDLSINAYQLVFAGKQIQFSTSVKEIQAENRIQIEGTATVDGEVVSDITFTVAPTSAPTSKSNNLMPAALRRPALASVPIR